MCFLLLKTPTEGKAPPEHTAGLFPVPTLLFQNAGLCFATLPPALILPSVLNKGPVILACSSLKSRGSSVRTNPVLAQHILHVDADNQRNDAPTSALAAFPQFSTAVLVFQQSGRICISVRRERRGTACTVIMSARHRARPRMETKGRFMTAPS